MWRLLGTGLVAAAAATALQAGLRFTVGTPLAPEEMAQVLFAWVPMPVFSVAIGLLGSAARWVAFAGMVALYLAMGVAAAPWVARGGWRAAPAWAAGSAVVQALVLSGRGGVGRGPAAALLAYLAASGLYVVTCLAASGPIGPQGRRRMAPGGTSGEGVVRNAGR